MRQCVVVFLVNVSRGKVFSWKSRYGSQVVRGRRRRLSPSSLKCMSALCSAAQTLRLSVYKVLLIRSCHEGDPGLRFSLNKPHSHCTHRARKHKPAHARTHTHVDRFACDSVSEWASIDLKTTLERGKPLWKIKKKRWTKWGKGGKV